MKSAGKTTAIVAKQIYFPQPTQKLSKEVQAINRRKKALKERGLSWYGVDFMLGPTWWLGGITPVGIDYVRNALKNS